MKKIEELLLKRIEETEDEIVALQVQIGGQTFAGAVKKSSEGEGFYEILTAGQHQNGEVFMVKCIFTGGDLQVIFESHEEKSDIIKPKGGIIIPGAH